jgi:hypothetical protein
MRNSIYLKIIIATILFVPITQMSFGQVLKPDAERTYYSEMWNVYNTHKRLSYIAPFPQMWVNGQSGLPLVFEANVSPIFTIFRGRDYGDFGYSRPQMKSFMIYFNPELTLRMYREEPIGTPTRSLPVLPINFVPRISLIKFFHSSTVPNSIAEFRKYQFIEFSVAHYSNGQENPHYLRDTLSVSGDSIANYTSGNFSTNYLRLGYTTGVIDGALNIYSANIYIQNDGGVGNLFSYENAQRKSYGKWRIGVTFQFQSKKTKFGSRRKQKVGLALDSPQSLLDKFSPIKKRTNYYATWMVRLSSETIVDNVSRYPSSKKYISATRLTFVFHPLNWRNFGLMAEIYNGRDFYNIRFYDQITQFKIGLLADSNFYLPRNTYD